MANKKKKVLTPSSSDDEEEEEDKEEISSIVSSSSTSSSSSSSGSSSSSSSVSTNNNNNNDSMDSDNDIESEENIENEKGSSNLFVGYRTIGIIQSGKRPCINQIGNETFLTIPIENRFQIMNQRLQPVLISRPTVINASAGAHQAVANDIEFVVNDPGSQITCVASLPDGVCMYYRTQVMDYLNLLKMEEDEDDDGYIVDMISLGKVKFGQVVKQQQEEKESRLLVAVLLCNSSDNNKKQKQNRKRSQRSSVGQIPIVGESDSETDMSEEDSSDDDDDDLLINNNSTIGGGGEIVILSLSKSEGMKVFKRVSLPEEFVPTCMIHPHTYLNKVLVGGTKGKLYLLNIRTGKLIHSFSCLSSSADDEEERLTVMKQSPALDTIGVGTSAGNVHLINLKYDKLLFSLYYSGSPVKALSFRTDSSCQRLGIAPLAIGFENGLVSVWDLTNNKVDKDTNKDDDSSSSSDDDSDSDGQDTPKRRLLYKMKPHSSHGLSYLEFLEGEPVLVTCGKDDNCIQMHIFDSPDYSSRLLRQRSGHANPSNFIRYLHGISSGNGGMLLQNSQSDGVSDASSCQILSCGGRELRSFSTARSITDREFSQGPNLTKKAKKLKLADKQELYLPPIFNFSTSQAKSSKEFGDLVSIHKNSCMAYVWSTKTYSQNGFPVLKQDDWHVSQMSHKAPPKTENASCVTISSCGNFVLVGTFGGKIYKYNIQSGLPRGSYPKNHNSDTDVMKNKNERVIGHVARSIKGMIQAPDSSYLPPNLDKAEQEQQAASSSSSSGRKQTSFLPRREDVMHKSMVTGLAVDSLNKTLISVCTEGHLIAWSFQNHISIKRKPFLLKSSAIRFCHVRDNDMAAIALADNSIVIIDCSDEKLCIIRRFSGKHTDRITDLGFGPDGRRLFSSSLDKTICVWDIPTGTLVDWLKFEKAPMSLTLSSSGEFLATSHQNTTGISLWCDQSFFQTVYLQGGSVDKPFEMDTPSPTTLLGSSSNKAEEKQRRQSDALAFLEKQNKQILGDNDNDDENKKDSVVEPKEEGLITMSGLPPAHWKNLFHLELVRERNKPKENEVQKAPEAPFFLQWRQNNDTDASAIEKKAADDDTKMNDGAKEDDNWNAVWSDDDDGGDDDSEDEDGGDGSKNMNRKSTILALPPPPETTSARNKKRKVTHTRSKLCSLLEECNDNFRSYREVTQYFGTLGPSAIDIALSSLCYGMHDTTEGIPNLYLCSQWLLEAIESKCDFEAVNAYLNRFLYLHSNVIAGIDVLDTKKKQKEEEQEGDASMLDDEEEQQQQQQEEMKDLMDCIGKLRIAQQSSSDKLREKMQHSLCLLKHFSRMV